MTTTTTTTTTITNTNDWQKSKGLVKSLNALKEKGNTFKLPVLMAKSQQSIKHSMSQTLPTSKQQSNRQTSFESQYKAGNAPIYLIPLMPDEKDEERVYGNQDAYCKFCRNICSAKYLTCKVCNQVAHVDCLYKSGHLDSFNVKIAKEWSCADCQKLCTDVGSPMTQKEEELERLHFSIMDTQSSGSITWNEFISYEAPSLLAKKDKIELSNHLSLNELFLLKQLFLKYDKKRYGLITQEDAKEVYLEYIYKLRKKLGRRYEELIQNCIRILGVQFEPLLNNDDKIPSHKVIWDEFVRKMTILLLYDRLNSQQYKPRVWNKRSMTHGDETTDNETNDTRIYDYFSKSFRNSKLNSQFNIKEKTQYGSHLYVIRSFNLKSASKRVESRQKPLFKLPNYRIRQPKMKLNDSSSGYFLRNTFSLNDFYLKSKFFKQLNRFNLHDDTKSLASFNVVKPRELNYSKKSNMSFY